MLTLTEAKQAIKSADRDTVEAIIEQHGEGALEAAIKCGVALGDVDEAYQGPHATDAEFAEDIADSLGLVEESNRWPNYCIDWEWAARELMMDYSEHNGHYFRNL